MKAEFATDTTEIDEEIAMLKSIRVNVLKGSMQAGRDDDGRLVFRMTTEGRQAVEQMVKRR